MGLTGGDAQRGWCLQIISSSLSLPGAAAVGRRWDQVVLRWLDSVRPRASEVLPLLEPPCTLLAAPISAALLVPLLLLPLLLSRPSRAKMAARRMPAAATAAALLPMQGALEDVRAAFWRQLGSGKLRWEAWEGWSAVQTDLWGKAQMRAGAPPMISEGLTQCRHQ